MGCNGISECVIEFIEIVSVIERASPPIIGQAFKNRIVALWLLRN